MRFKSKIYGLVLFMLVYPILFLCPTHFKELEATELAFQGQVLPSVTLNIGGAVNARGRRTVLTGSSINFGNVLFSQPQLITNGDAFLDEDKYLNLEATLELEGVFGGVSSLSFFISRLSPSTSSFSKLLYSLGTRRSDQVFAVPVFPERRALRESVTTADPFKIRVIGVIQPTQTGALFSTFRIEGEARN